MKRLTCVICIILLYSSMFSCAPRQFHEDDIIIQKIGFTGGMAEISVDLNNFVDVTEMSSQIIECTVLETKNISVNDLFDLVFTYSVWIDDIFLDTSGKLRKGDTIDIMTTEGYVRASNICALMRDKDAARAEKLGLYADREYAPNEYVLSSSWDAIPMENGRSYILYLTDQYLEKQDVYSECGYSFLFDVTGKDVYWKSGFIKYDLKKIALIKQIREYIDARTGRADEIGWGKYMSEVQAERNGEKTGTSVE